MSEMERKRRVICRFVLKEAWNLRRKVSLFTYSFSTCLKLSWATIKGKILLRRSKARGVTFANKDGVNRQNILSRLLKYKNNQIFLEFRREYDNLHDSNAIQIAAVVVVDDAVQGAAVVGYVSKEIAAVIAPLMDGGKQAVVLFDSITGKSKPNYGMNFSYAVI